MVMEFIQMMVFWIVSPCHSDNDRLLWHITLNSFMQCKCLWWLTGSRTNSESAQLHYCIAINDSVDTCSTQFCKSCINLLKPTGFYTHAQVYFIFEHHGHLRRNQTLHHLISEPSDYHNSSHQLLFVWTTGNKWLNITSEWATLLLEIYQTSPERLATPAGLLWFASFPPGKCYNCTSD
jgi:hypothetical protein